MNIRTNIVVALVCFAWTVSSAAGQGVSSPGPVLAGNDTQVWMLLPRPDGSVSDVFFRPLGKAWQRGAFSPTGNPAAAVAVGDRLHLLYADQQHVILDSSGATQIAGNLPGSLLVACQGEGMGEAKSSTVFALVREPIPPGETDAPASQPQTAPAAWGKALRTPALRESLYCLFGNGWKRLASRPLPARSSRWSFPRYLAVCDGHLYWLGRRESGPRPRPFVLRRYAPDAKHARWTDVYTLPEGRRPAGMVGLDARLFLVLQPETDPRFSPDSAPAETSLHLLCYNAKKQTATPPIPIHRNGEAVSWPGRSAVAASRLDRQIALLWSESSRPDSSPQFALCRQGGELEPTETISELLQNTPDMEFVSELYHYFLLAVMVAIGAGVFFRRTKFPPQPFCPSEKLLPGNLFKRLLAVMIDFLPFYILASVIFMPSGLSVDDARQYLQEPSSAPPVLLAAALYTLMLAQSLYVAYGTFMEVRFGATLGKRLLRLRAVREDGTNPDLRSAVLRNVTKVVELSMLMSPIGWLMTILVMLPLLTRYRQRMGDMLARTLVVDANRRGETGPPPLPNQEENRGE